jgi:ligand-binding sensor domain-containing protein/serine phosphatase RsbU (regulator of sigma subunit)/membrane-bound lytic murein transglycosylase MltF
MNPLTFQPAGAMPFGKCNAPGFSGQHSKNSGSFFRFAGTFRWFRRESFYSGRKRHLLFFFLCLIVGIVFTIPSEGRSLQEIKRSGKLYIGLTQWDYANINYPLALEFARYLNVKPVEVTIDWNEVFSRNGKIPSDIETNPSIRYTPDAFKKVDIVCSTFSILEWRQRLFDFARTLYSAELLLVGSEGIVPEHYRDLSGKKIAFMKGTSFETHMQEINRETGDAIQLIPVKTTDESKELLLKRKVFGIVLDADEALQFFSENQEKVRIAFPVSPISRSAWAVEKNSDLRFEVEDFFEAIAENGVLDRIFYGKFHIRYSSYVAQLRKTARPKYIRRDLDQIIAAKELVVAFRERNFVFHEGENKQFMHALAEEFADYLGVRLDYVITPNSSKYFENKEGKIVKDSSYTPDWFNCFDVACDIFVPVYWRTNKVDLVPLFPGEYSLVARKKTHIANDKDLLKLRGVVAKGTVYEDILLGKGCRDLMYTDVDHFLEAVSSGKADYAIILNAFFELSEFPELEIKFPMGETEICWAVRKDQPLLKKSLQHFIAESNRNGLLKILQESLHTEYKFSTEAIMDNYYESFQAGQFPYVLYGTEDGLPQEDVLSILQDKRGYMWFGTNAGAARYNGREMQVYDRHNGLPGNAVNGMAVDSSGTLYFATSRGIAVMAGEKIQRIFLEGEPFAGVYVDSFQNKWFLGNPALHMLSSEGKIVSYAGSIPAVSDMGCIPKTRSYFFATSEGIFLLNPGGDFIRLTSEPCLSLLIDPNENIWYSTPKGLFIIGASDLAEGKLHQVRRLNETLGLSGGAIKKILASRYGGVWLLSDYRFYQVFSLHQRAKVFEQEIGLKNNTILSLYEDTEDNLWIGFSGGLQRMTNKKGLRNFYPNIINSYVYSVVQDKQGSIWIASNNGVFSYDGRLTDVGKKLGITPGRAVLGKYPDGRIVIATAEKLYLMNPASGSVAKTFTFHQPLLRLERMFISSKGEIFLMTGSEGKVYYLRHPGDPVITYENRATSNVHTLIEAEGRIYGGNRNGIIEFGSYGFRLVKDIGHATWSVCYDEGKFWIGTDNGLYVLQNNELQKVPYSNQTDVVIKSIIPAKNKAYLWLGTNKGFVYLNKLTLREELSMSTKDGLLGGEITTGGLFVDASGILWISTYHGLSNFNLRAASVQAYAPICYLERIFLNGKEIKPEIHRKFKRKENNLVFEISALTFSDEGSVEYEFYLRGLENDYSSYNKGMDYKAVYTNLPPGKYEFVYKARGKNGIWGYSQKYSFMIRKAWYETWIFKISLIILIVTVFVLINQWRIYRIQKQKEMLEKLVKERTRELEDANEEIELQRDLAERQRDQIYQQKKEILDSIQYAAQIQKAILPSNDDLNRILPDHFILFRPKDVVSGDFYWAAQKNGRVIITAADSTGHGVPGAFMSFLGITFLTEVVGKNDEITPALLLDNIRSYIIRILGQKGTETEHKDGIDMGLCIIDPVTRKGEFAGANNNLVIVRKGELLEIKGDKMPIGIHRNMVPFTNHLLTLEASDMLYLFSDGYPDQFGGPSGKKMLRKTFKEILLEISALPMSRQYDILEERFIQWKKDYEQTDDVLVIGIRV